MKLYIKQSIFTLGEKFEVKDIDQNTVYYVEGSFLRIPKQFKITDRHKNQVAVIESQILRWLGHYDIKTVGKSITLKKEFTFLKPVYSIEGINWRLQGDLMGYQYTVTEGSTLIMELRKHWFTWGDSYELNIPNPSDALLALCIVICVDSELGKTRAASATT